MQLEDVAGRGVLVTGGGSSVGRAIAELFAGEGARVHVGDNNAQFVEQLRRESPKIGASVCDVSDPSSIEHMFRDAEKSIGQVDFLVNCVGIAGPRGLIEEIDPAEWRHTIDANFHAIFETMRRAIPGMKQRRFGAIVNFSTASTKTGLPSRAAYIAGKAGLEALTYTAARELGDFGVRCNTIRPGAINNQRMNDVIARSAKARGLSEAQVEEQLLKHVTLHRKIEPSELAATVLFLCAHTGRSITGQCIEVSGNLEWEE